jgi:dienelactone hydrolase
MNNMIFSRSVRALILLTVLFLSASAYAVTRDEVWIPGPGGKKLHGYVYSPETGGKQYPLLIINHGTPVSKNNLPAIGYTWKYQARYFAQMGFVVVTFARRGYGKSEGSFEEEHANKCERMIYNHDNLENEGYKDNESVIAWAATLPKADIRKGVVMAGLSAGGFTSLNVASKDKRVKAAINFAGGAGGNPKGNICLPDVLAGYFKKFGATVPYPTLWFYAEDDDFFQADRAGKAFAEEYTKGGGSVIFNRLPSGQGGHGWFSRKANIETWGPIVKEYLKKRGFHVR